jgi:hypothetical protein
MTRKKTERRRRRKQDACGTTALGPKYLPDYYDQYLEDLAASEGMYDRRKTEHS